MQIDFAATVPKAAETADWNEDHWEDGADRGVITLCDGASESFDSRSWAESLCRNHLHGSVGLETWVAEATQEYDSLYQAELLSWSKAAALQRGSFSTLLSIKYDQDRSELEVFAIGDSIVVLCEGGGIRATFPISSASEFEERPLLLSTKASFNSFLTDPSFLTKATRVEAVSGATTCLMMTDALGHWCLRSQERGDAQWRFLLEVASEQDFRDFVVARRASGELKIDDTTLLRVSF